MGTIVLVALGLACADIAGFDKYGLRSDAGQNSGTGGPTDSSFGANAGTNGGARASGRGGVAGTAANAAGREDATSNGGGGAGGAAGAAGAPSVSCPPGLAGDDCQDCVRFVVPNGSGSRNGLSWGNAVGSVQEAINAARLASSSDRACSVWVAAGTYPPGNQKTDSVRVPEGVSLYGGFAGSERSLAARLLPSNETILTGALPDGASSDHVVVMSGGYLRDITIASGSSEEEGGGGLVVDGGKVVVADCTFRDNHAAEGGAITVNSGELVLEHVQLVRNHATGNGGALFVGDGTVTVTDCSFVGNVADQRGGGLFGAGATNALLIQDSRFVGNSANTEEHTEGGGAIEVEAATTIWRSRFIGNAAAGVGGAIQVTDGRLDLMDSSFIGNQAGRQFASYGVGGAVRSVNSIARVERCQFIGNWATSSGTLDVAGGRITVDSSLFWGNGAWEGAGIVCVACNAQIRGTTIVGNVGHGDDPGVVGGVAAWVTPTVTIVGSILTENLPSSIAIDSGLEVTVDFTVVDGWSDGLDNLDGPPGFVAWELLQGPADWSLRADALSRDLVPLDRMPTLDLFRQPRAAAQSGASADAGAIEYSATGSCGDGHVDELAGEECDISAVSGGCSLSCHCDDVQPPAGAGPGCAARSCLQLHTDFPELDSGLYWIRPGSGQTAFRTYCDMQSAGGGWTLVAIYGPGARPLPSVLDQAHPRPGASFYGVPVAEAFEAAGNDYLAASFSIDAKDLWSESQREIMAYVGGTTDDFVTATLDRPEWSTSCNFFDQGSSCTENTFCGIRVVDSSGNTVTDNACACTTARGREPWENDPNDEFGLHLLDGHDDDPNLHCYANTASSLGVVAGVRGSVFVTAESSTDPEFRRSGVLSHWKQMGTASVPGALLIR